MSYKTTKTLTKKEAIEWIAEIESGIQKMMIKKRIEFELESRGLSTRDLEKMLEKIVDDEFTNYLIIDTDK